MNELKLSTDLNVITAEINSYKQVAGQAIFEIGKRLNHVKENDLVHGEFGKWLETMEVDRNFATRSMKIADELSDSNYVTWNNLSQRALYEIATLPIEEREKEHTLPSGETKEVDEMTVRELQEVKRQLKKARESEQIAINRLEEEQSKEPELIKEEIIKEVVPEHIKQELTSTKRQLEFVNNQLLELEKNNNDNKLDNVDFNEAEAENERKKLEWEAERNVLTLKIKVDKFLEEIAINAFMEGAIASSGVSTKEKLRDSIESLKNFTNKMETVLSGRIEI